jgi:hypothetical protein
MPNAHSRHLDCLPQKLQYKDSNVLLMQLRMSSSANQKGGTRFEKEKYSSNIDGFDDGHVGTCSLR